MIPTRRPALIVAALYAAGILLGYRSNPPLWPLLVAAIFLTGICLFFRHHRKEATVSSWLLAIALLLVACSQYEIRTRLFPVHHIVHLGNITEPVVIQGRVVSEPVLKGENAALLLEAAALDCGTGLAKVCGKVWLRVRDFRGQLGYGDQVRLRGRLRPPEKARNPGEFDYQAYLARRSIYVVMSLRSESILVIGEGKLRWWQGVVRAVRQHLDGVVSGTLTGPPKDLLLGVLLGERRGLPPEVMKAFSDSGVIHVLAVSGLHVGLIVGIFLSFFRALRLKEVQATFLTLALVFLYMYVVELRPSVVRATIMAAVVMVGRLLERESDLLNAIAFAGLVLLLWSPQSLFELGFQLSFVATLSIVYFHERLVDLFRPIVNTSSPQWVRWVCSGFLVSVSAQLGTLPIIAYYFQKIPVISVVANLFVVPLIGLIVALGFTSAILGIVSMTLARLYATANWVLLSVLLRLVNLASSLPFAYLQAPRPTGMFIILYYGFLILGSNFKRSLAARRTFLFGGLLLLNLLAWQRALEDDERLSVVFFDVGQGDAALVRFPNGRAMLIDGGERKAVYDCGERVICPYLRRIGLRRLDVVVLTHADNDHVGGLPAVLEEIPVRLVLDGGAKHLTATYLRFLELAQVPEVTYREVRAGDQLEICPGVQVAVLHPTEKFVTGNGEAPFGLNNASVVLRVQYGEISFLFAGDIERETEEELWRRGCRLNSTVLKVPHHGSQTSSSRAFLRLVRPCVAIISVGQSNRFGHPHPDVLQRYRRANVDLYRTDRDGAVTVSTDGRKLRLHTTLGKGRRWTKGPWERARTYLMGPHRSAK